jgi:serralysin
MANTFSVTLTGAQETPPNASAANGTGTITWNAAANALTYDFIVKGLNFGQVTGMQFHSGAAGMTGPLAFGPLNPPLASGQLNPPQDTNDFKTIMNADGSWTVQGVWELTDPASIPITNFAPVLSSATVGSVVPLYWNVQTIAFPNGEIRGQLNPIA